MFFWGYCGHTKLKVFVIFLLFFSVGCWRFCFVGGGNLQVILWCLSTFIYLHTYHKPHFGPGGSTTSWDYFHTHPYWVQSKSPHNPTLPLTSYPPHPNYYASQHYWLLCISGQLVGTFHLNCPVVILRRAPQKKVFPKGGGSIGKKSDIDSIHVETDRS